MKIIQYDLCRNTDSGGEQENARSRMAVELPYSAENMELARKEAYNGEITVAETADTEQAQTELDIVLGLLADHEYRLCMQELRGEVSE